MLTLSLLTESEESIDMTFLIDRYSLFFIFVIECRNFLLFFEVSNIELFFTFSLSIFNLTPRLLINCFTAASITKMQFTLNTSEKFAHSLPVSYRNESFSRLN